MQLGIDVFLSDENFKTKVKGKNIALIGHPASVTSDLTHSLDALLREKSLTVTAAFGPQHGMRGDKQDNMIESDDFVDPLSKVSIFSLYGKVRRPTAEMLKTFDVVLIDMQDVGCRIYTYLTTLYYMLEDCAKAGKEVWVLDRPNPIGRPVEGTILKKGFESFVGMGPVLMRHGMTLGELALWIVKKYKLDVKLTVVAMKGYKPSEAPGYGWPTKGIVSELSWVNPSPNIPTLDTARCFNGTVMLEGVNLSEGRGTTRPLQLFGAPKLKSLDVLSEMKRMAPDWMKGCMIRQAFFEPTFHKFKGELCEGIQIHTDNPKYDHENFKPYRLMLLFFKALRHVQPGFLQWRQPPYEYEHDRLPIDLLTGGTEARSWVDDDKQSVDDLERLLSREEKAWLAERAPFLLY